MTVKLKSTGVKPTRLALLEAQGWRCAICGEHCPEDQAALDHDHRAGHVRAVLHRGCNSLLGKNENNAPRYGMSPERLVAFLTGAAAYLERHRTNQTGLVHPTFFTAEERVERRRAKAKRVRAKLKATRT